MGSGCSTRGLGDSRGPDPDLPDAAASLRLLCSGEGLTRDQGQSPPASTLGIQPL